MTNSAGLTGATPISMFTLPFSVSFSGMVAALVAVVDDVRGDLTARRTEVYP